MVRLHSAAELAPLDYRYALDAAMTMLAPTGPPHVYNNLPQLEDEVRWRIPLPAETIQASGILWIEPLPGVWLHELERLVQALSLGAPLVVVASLRRAQSLIECRSWEWRALGFQPRGIRRLEQALRQAGLRIEASYGFHTQIADRLAKLGQLVARCGHPGLGDQLHFRAHLQYYSQNLRNAHATVALLLARKEQH
ncbi:MAG: hypothetical protein MI924_29990 [Chloroflexales bacterium]|nr:hypothetical protein [Chloroflexales bacterium]